MSTAEMLWHQHATYGDSKCINIVIRIESLSEV